MIATFSSVRLALCILLIQFLVEGMRDESGHLVEIQGPDLNESRQIVHETAKYDSCHVFGVLILADVCMHANKDCTDAFDHFLLLPENERVGCRNPNRNKAECHVGSFSLLPRCHFECDDDRMLIRNVRRKKGRTPRYRKPLLEIVKKVEKPAQGIRPLSRRRSLK